MKPFDEEMRCAIRIYTELREYDDPKDQKRILDLVQDRLTRDRTTKVTLSPVPEVDANE